MHSLLATLYSVGDQLQQFGCLIDKTSGKRVETLNGLHIHIQGSAFRLKCLSDTQGVSDVSDVSRVSETSETSETCSVSDVSDVSRDI